MAIPQQYIIRFIGRVSWEGQANGLPPEIFAYIFYEGNDTNAINGLLELQAKAFINAQAMFVQQEQGKVIDIRQTPSERMMVPMRWIVSLTTDIHRLGAELSKAEDGKEVLSDGSTPLIN